MSDEDVPSPILSWALRNTLEMLKLFSYKPYNVHYTFIIIIRSFEHWTVGKSPQYTVDICKSKKKPAGIKRKIDLWKL